MIEAAVEHGHKLAVVLHKLQANNDLFPLLTFDGAKWWYYNLQKHVWVQDKGGSKVHDMILSTIQRDYGHLLEISKRNNEKASVIDSIQMLMMKCNERRFRELLAKDCAMTFLDELFLSKLNRKHNLIACKNGVFDIETGVFRVGYPSDYLTLNTHREFVTAMHNANHPDHLAHRVKFEECRRFVKDVLVDDQVIEMMMSAMALSMNSVMLHKFFLWVGCGSNGKSKLATLFRVALGDYTITIPVTVFTQKRIEYGKACPELQRTQGRRVVFISEPSHNETLNLGIVKEVTGGDTMFTRGLYEEGQEIQCRFTPVLLCNVLPNVTDTSHGAWRRLVSVEFPTLFVETPTQPNEKRLDALLDTKLERWADVFLTWLLTSGYQKAKADGMSIPDSVTLSTSTYARESDFYTDFFNEKMVRTNLPCDRVTWTQVWTHFYYWFKHSHGLEHLPKKVECRKRFESEHFKQKLVKGEWCGFLLPTVCSAGR
jgi:P4 family phage/plasmid primase-like protien